MGTRDEHRRKATRRAQHEVEPERPQSPSSARAERGPEREETRVSASGETRHPSAVERVERRRWSGEIVRAVGQSPAAATAASAAPATMDAPISPRPTARREKPKRAMGLAASSRRIGLEDARGGVQQDEREEQAENPVFERAAGSTEDAHLFLGQRNQCNRGEREDSPTSERVAVALRMPTRKPA